MVPNEYAYVYSWVNLSKSMIGARFHHTWSTRLFGCTENDIQTAVIELMPRSSRCYCNSREGGRRWQLYTTLNSFSGATFKHFYCIFYETIERYLNIRQHFYNSHLYHLQSSLHVGFTVYLLCRSSHK